MNPGHRHITLDDLIEELEVDDERVAQIEAVSDEERERQERRVVVAEREALKEFHTFLSYNSKDKALVRNLRDTLRQQGIAVWFDDDEILGGDQFIPVLESILARVPSALVLIGPHGTGPWHDQEYYALLQRYVEPREEAGRRLRLIPVLLPGASEKPQLPVFLRGFNAIDLHLGLDDRQDMRRLVRSILSEEREYER